MKPGDYVKQDLMSLGFQHVRIYRDCLGAYESAASVEWCFPQEDAALPTWNTRIFGFNWSFETCITDFQDLVDVVAGKSTKWGILQT